MKLVVEKRIMELFTFRTPVKWVHSTVIITFHLYLIIFALWAFFKAKLLTIVFNTVVGVLSGFGVTAGAHRLWSHRSFKAIAPIRFFLMIMYTTSQEKSIYEFVKVHKLHHKYSDTDGDPHNINRGFFYAHCGYLMLERLPEVVENEKKFDFGDILSDPIIKFQHKYYRLLQLIFAYIIPISVPILFWNESLIIAFNITIIRVAICLHCLWCIQSAAHVWGTKPYNAVIEPTENYWFAVCTLGEGWHNYHHAFPWDFKASEFGPGKINFTTRLLLIFAKFGWIFDMKEASEENVKNSLVKYGDGSQVATLQEVPYENIVKK